MKIFEFWKKFLKAYGDAFYDVQLLGFFYKNLYLLTYEEMLMKKSKKHYDFKSSAEHFLFKLLSFCKKWSYWYQIGLKLKLICSSFKKSKEGNFSLMVFHNGHEKINLLMKIRIKSWFTAHKLIQNINWTFDLKLSQKLLQNSFHLRPIWNL